MAGTFDELRARAGELRDAYLRVTVNTDGPVPGLSDQVREILPGAMYVKAEYAREEEDGVLAGASLMSLSHREQFGSFYKAKHQIDPSEEIVAAFEEVYAAASGAEGPPPIPPQPVPASARSTGQGMEGAQPLRRTNGVEGAQPLRRTR